MDAIYYLIALPLPIVFMIQYWLCGRFKSLFIKLIPTILLVVMIFVYVSWFVPKLDIGDIKNVSQKDINIIILGFAVLASTLADIFAWFVFKLGKVYKDNDNKF